eukprot:4776780-Amphidinium_carterae.1
MKQQKFDNVRGYNEWTVQKNKYRNTRKYHRQKRSWNSTSYYRRKRSTCGKNLENYQDPTSRTAQKKSTHGTTSTKNTVRHQRLHQSLPGQLPTGIQTISTSADRTRLLFHSGTYNRATT